MVLFKILKSIKLAVMIIGYLVITSLISTFIPQGENFQYYLNKYHHITAGIILTLGFDRFFKSLLFLIPSGLIFINLLLCTADRIIKQIRAKVPFQPGPDIIHIGILIIMISGVVTLAGRKEGVAYISPGDKIILPDNTNLKLASFTYEQYKDGRPKMWRSKILLSKQNTPESLSVIEVNHPLVIRNLTVFQYGYKDLSSVSLKDKYGNLITLAPDMTVNTGEKVFRFIKASTDSTKLLATVPVDKAADLTAFFIIDGDGASLIPCKKGDSIGSVIITDITPVLKTGLNFVYDPGSHITLYALILIATGLVITFISKTKRR